MKKNSKEFELISGGAHQDKHPGAFFRSLIIALLITVLGFYGAFVFISRL